MVEVKKRRKIHYIVILVLCACLITGGVFGLRYFNQANMEAPPFFSTMTASYNEAGLLTYEENYILYGNAVTGKKSLICDDAQCIHSPKDGSKCGSVVSALILSGLCIWDDSLYFISDMNSDKIGKCAIYSSDLNGKNRRKLGDLAADIEVISAVTYEEKYAYIAYQNSSSITDSEYESTVGVYQFDLEKKTGKILYEKTAVNAGIYGLAADDTGVYFAEAFADISAQEIYEYREDEEYATEHTKNYILGVDVESGKELFYVDGIVSDNQLPYIDGSLYFVQDGHAMRYQISEGELKQVANQECYAISSVLEDVIYFRGVGESAWNAYYEYTPENDQWKKLGESNFRAQAIFSDYIYGLVPESDSEDAELVDGFMKTEGFESANYDTVEIFESEIKMDE